LHPSGVAKSSTSFGWGKGGNVTSAGWQVTLCDPVWHVSSCSAVTGLTANYRIIIFYFTFAVHWAVADNWRRIVRESSSRNKLPILLFCSVTSCCKDFLKRFPRFWRADLGHLPAQCEEYCGNQSYSTNSQYIPNVYSVHHRCQWWLACGVIC